MKLNTKVLGFLRSRQNCPANCYRILFLAATRVRDNGLTLTPLYRFARIMSFDFIKIAEKVYIVFAVNNDRND